MDKLEDLREWLLSKIDGSEETRGEDSLISGFIAQIDALPSETGPIPASRTQAKRFAAQAGTPLTDAAVVQMERLDGDIDEVVAATFARTLERELIDLKQRLLPQYLGRAARCEKERQMAVVERDEMLEKLRAATSMPCAPSATGATVLVPSEPTEEMLKSACNWRDRLEVGDPADVSMNDQYRAFYKAMLAAAPVENKGTALPVEETAPDRPDWARQLPGAEIFDRAARYEYIRTLNLRQFAALYDAALRGERFDDVVDRYRDAGGRPK